MKDILINKTKCFITLFVLSVFAIAFNSCESDNINTNTGKEIEIVDDKAFLHSANSMKSSIVLEMYTMDENAKDEFYLETSNNAKEELEFESKIDNALILTYNRTHNTTYEEYPASLISLANNGVVKIAAGSKKSNNIQITVSKDDKLVQVGKTYLVPLTLSPKKGNISLSKNREVIYYIVKALDKGDTDKGTGIQIVSCMETNDTNPLNNLNFTMKKSGKPLVDIVILFSGNINWDPQKGVYVHLNKELTYIMEHRERMIKPLQDRGMKVVMGILGNHDRSGVANLADQTAVNFAQELKAMCDIYGLDGVFFDDEYSDYSTIYPGFVNPSYAAASRLCYETKKAMPDKLVSVYAYGGTGYLPAVKDLDTEVVHQSGTFVDMGLHDYLRSSDLSANYPGMPKSGMGQHSQEFSRGYWTNKSNLQSMRDGGYGKHMIFAMDPYRSNKSRQIRAMQEIAEVLFDDELVVDENFHPAEWK